MARNRRKKNRNKSNKNPNPYLSTATVEKTMENLVNGIKALETTPAIIPAQIATYPTNIGMKGYTPIKGLNGGTQPVTQGYKPPVSYGFGDDIYTGYTYTWARCSHVHDEVAIANGKIYASGSRATADNIKDTGKFYIEKQVSIFLDGLSWKPITGLLVDITNSNKSPLVKGTNYITWPDFSTISDDRYIELLNNTLSLLNKGYEIEIGCIGAHGRTGTLIAGLIVLTEGLDAKSAIKAVRDRLCDHCVETKSQENMIYALCGEPLLPVPIYTPKVATYYDKYNTFNNQHEDMLNSGNWYTPSKNSKVFDDIEDLWNFDEGEEISIRYFGVDKPLEEITEDDFKFNVDLDTFVIMTDYGEHISIEQYDRYMSVHSDTPWWVKEVNEVLETKSLKEDTSPPSKFTPETKVKTSDGAIKLNWIIAKDFILDEELNCDVLFTEDDQVITREMYNKIVNVPFKEDFLEYRVSDEEFTAGTIKTHPITLKTQMKIKMGLIPLSAILPSDFTWNKTKLRYEIYTFDNRIVTGKEYLLLRGNTGRDQFLGAQGKELKGE